MALNRGPVLCARPESALCQMLATSSLRKPWLALCAGTAPNPRGRKRPGSLQGGLLIPRPVNPRTGVGCKSRCLMCGSIPYTAGQTSALPLHLLFLTGAPSTDLCSLSFRITPSVCDRTQSGEFFYYLMFNYYLGCGFWSCPERCSVECVLEMCPRQTTSCRLVGCLLPAVLAFAGKRAEEAGILA